MVNVKQAATGRVFRPSMNLQTTAPYPCVQDDSVNKRWSRRAKILVSVAGTLMIIAGAVIALQPETVANGFEFDAGQGPAGVATFSSNIPVIVLRSDRRGSVSTTKTYTPFT